MNKITAFLFLFLCSPAHAYLKYDSDTGDNIRSEVNWREETKENGVNLKTGESWNTTVEPNGDMNGLNKDGESWRYDKQNDTFYNYNKGCSKSKYYDTCD